MQESTKASTSWNNTTCFSRGLCNCGGLVFHCVGLISSESLCYFVLLPACFPADLLETWSPNSSAQEHALLTRIFGQGSGRRFELYKGAGLRCDRRLLTMKKVTQFWGNVLAMPGLFWSRLRSGHSCKIKFSKSGKNIPDWERQGRHPLQSSQLACHQLQLNVVASHLCLSWMSMMAPVMGPSWLSYYVSTSFWKGICGPGCSL